MISVALCPLVPSRPVDRAAVSGGGPRLVPVAFPKQTPDASQWIASTPTSSELGAARRWRVSRWLGVVLLGVALAQGGATRPVAPGPANGPARMTWADLPAETQVGLGAAMRQARPIDGTSALAFRNPDQQLQATIDAAQVRIVGTAGASVRMGAPAVGRGARVVPLVAEATTGVGTARVETVRRAGPVVVTEWWANEVTGLSQGFVVATRPAGAGWLTVQQTLETPLMATVTAAADTVVLSDATGERLRFAGLRAWDATGRVLTAQLVAGPDTLVMRVDDAAATYPVTIDPTWSQQAYLKASNTGAGDEFGSAVAVAGDTVVVGGPDEDSAATGVNGDWADNRGTGAGAARAKRKQAPKTMQATQAETRVLRAIRS